MNYIDQVARSIYELTATDDPSPEDMRLYRIYAVLALTKGDETTLEDVHDAWSAWQADIMPEHRSIVPFARLSPEVQEYDAEYRDAIHRASENGWMFISQGSQ